MLCVLYQSRQLGPWAEDKQQKSTFKMTAGGKLQHIAGGARVINTTYNNWRLYCSGESDWRYGIFLWLIIIQWTDPNQRWIDPRNACVIKPLYFIFSCAAELYCIVLSKKNIKMRQWATLLHWMIHSFTTMNTELIPHTPSCCCKYSLGHQMSIAEKNVGAAKPMLVHD